MSFMESKSLEEMIRKETGGRPIRAFVSVELPEDIKIRILAENSSLNMRGARLVADDQLHVTLFFFDKIDNERLLAVITLFELLEQGKFDIAVEGLGLFDPRHPRIIYANVKDNGVLVDIYKRLKGQIASLGIEVEEREYTPHVTIARVKGADKEVEVKLNEFVSTHRNNNYGGFTCGEIKIIKSELTETGPIYTELYTKKLG